MINLINPEATTGRIFHILLAFSYFGYKDGSELNTVLVNLIVDSYMVYLFMMSFLLFLGSGIISSSRVVNYKDSDMLDLIEKHQLDFDYEKRRDALRTSAVVIGLSTIVPSIYHEEYFRTTIFILATAMWSTATNAVLNSLRIAIEERRSGK